MSTFTEPLSESDPEIIYSGDGGNYFEVTSGGPWQATDLVAYRLTHQFAACKMIALGYDCTTLHFTWAIPTGLLFSALSQEE